MLLSYEPGGVLDPAQEERKGRGKSDPTGPNAAEKATHELTRNWCSYCVRARAADDPHHRQPLKDHHGRLLLSAGRTRQGVVHNPGHVERCSRHDGGNQRGGNGPATHIVSVVVEHLRAWGRKKVIFRIDGEPAIRALGVAIQCARSEETVIECRPKCSSIIDGSG